MNDAGTELLDDYEVVTAFVAFLREEAYPNLEISYRPDNENCVSSDIDAIAGPFAIEHTSVDTVANQRRDSDWYVKAVGGIAAAVGHMLPYRLDISIPYGAVERGQDWLGIQDAFIAWITDYSASLGEGLHTVTGVPGVPFDFFAKKDSQRKPSLFIARIAPEDNSFLDLIREQFVRKARKLAPYKDQGYVTILLVESNDIALMNEGKMLDAIRTALSSKLPSGVDRLWYVATDIPEHLLFYEFTEAVRKE